MGKRKEERGEEREGRLCCTTTQYIIQFECSRTLFGSGQRRRRRGRRSQTMLREEEKEGMKICETGQFIFMGEGGRKRRRRRRRRTITALTTPH